MTAPGDAYDFGRYLQQLRRAKEIPLEAVSQVTKIRLVVLQQIENEDLKALPTPTLTKGFIRAFADAVGADQAEALRRYHAALVKQAPQSENTPAIEEKPGSGWYRLLLAIILIGLLIALSLYLVNLPRQTKPAGPAQAPSVEERRPTPAPRPDADAPAPASEAPPDVEKPATDGLAPEPAEFPSALTESTAKDDRTVETEAAQASLEAGPGDTNTERESVSTPAEPPVAQSGEMQNVAQTAEPKWVLRVTAVELTWLQVTTDDRPPREMMLQPDEQVTLKAHSLFQLVIGNAAGVELQLNGEPVNVPGGSGKVVRLQLP